MRIQNESPLLLDPSSNSSDNPEFKLFLSMAEHAPILGVDTESNGKDLRTGEGHTVGMSVAFSHDGINGYSYYFPFRHEHGNLNWSYRDKLKTLIESKPLTAHHLRHDKLALESIGINVPKDARCSLLAAHNVNENYLSYGLDYLARSVVGIDGKMREDDFKMYLKAFGWGGIPAQVMAPYAARDAELHLEVHNHFWPLYMAEGGGDRWEVEKEYAYFLNTMEGNGIEVDLELAQQQILLGELRMQEIVDDLGLNPGSNKDLKKLLIDEMGLPVHHSGKTGPSFDKKAMEYYEELLEYSHNPLAGEVLEYRGFQKAVSSYWKAYLRLVGLDGRIHPNFKQHGTKNSRLSCADPNGQQIPRVTSKPWNRRVKAGFVPRGGYRLWEADYKQLEMRELAAYSKEPKLIKIFMDDNRDLFDEMALEMGEPRYDVKQLSYAIGYGAKPDKIAWMLNRTRAQGQNIYDKYFDKYPALLVLNDLAMSVAKGQGFVKFWTGRRRHFENPHMEAHKAVNSVMQGGAAEIVKRIQLRLDKEIDPECLQVLQIHDAVVFEIPDGQEKKHLPEIKRIMEDTPAIGADFGIPFRVDVHEWAK